MRVGLYFDLRNPPEWRRDPTRLYSFTLEMCEEAERLGIDSLWVTEHHQFDDDYLPTPLTMLAAIAARTTRPRLGTAIVIAPLHAPVEIAEQAAVVDVLSGGRLDLGLGAGYRVPEFDLFDADLRQRYTSTDQCARELRDLWSESRVTPRPIQERVPIWLGYQGPKGAHRAGVLGEGLLTPDSRSYAPYVEGLTAGGHNPRSARMAGGLQGWVTDDPERDWPMVAKHLGYQVNSYRRHMVQGTDSPLPRPVDPERLRANDPRTVLDYFFYGTPGEVAARIAAMTADAPVEEVFFWASLGGMPEDMTVRHVQTVCGELAPRLRAPVTAS